MQIQSQHRVAVFDSSVIALDTKKGRYLLYDAATGRYASGLSRLSHMLSDMAGTVFIDVNKDSAEWNDSRLSTWGVGGASAEK